MNNSYKMLQVVSILMIIFGAINSVISLIGLLGVFVLVAAGLSPVLILAYLMLIAGGIAELVVGIIGVINCKDHTKGQMLMICGIVVAGLMVLGNLLAMILSGDFNPMTLISGLLFPVLFIVGAMKLKNGGPVA